MVLHPIPLLATTTSGDLPRRRTKVLPLGKVKGRRYASCSERMSLDLENRVFTLENRIFPLSPLQEGCEGIKQVPWRAWKVVRDEEGCPAKRIWQTGSPLVYPAQEGHIKELFCPLSHVFPCSKNDQPCKSCSPPPSAISTFFLHTLFTKTSVSLPPTPLRHISIPQIDLFSVSASRSSHSYSLYHKPQLSHDYKVTTKHGRYRLNIPGVGKPQREFSNCESRRWNSMYQVSLKKKKSKPNCNIF